MYVGGPPDYFAKIAHFYDGYVQALNEHFGIELYRRWNYWVTQELNPKFKNHVWSGVMSEFYKTDALLLENFPRLLEKYLYSKEFDETGGDKN